MIKVNKQSKPNAIMKGTSFPSYLCISCEKGVRLLRADLYLVLTHPRHVLFPKIHLVSNLARNSKWIFDSSFRFYNFLRDALFFHEHESKSRQRDLHHDFFLLLLAFSTIDSEGENDVSRSPNWK
ncbi:hypothetical protein CEXT_233331 [Caerostris extrusa]|uniref:Uncharacterized protein n=1 Tax=Caerostris extrusa TaxID=172846 RepID=A0AAV4WQA5_CAEEX|nr:hypothetical protein CEXT_233331 [Caerostris extrusa]